MIQQWTFAIYFFIILYAILFYSICTLLFPSDLRDYSGYEEYFLSRRRWFFGFLAATFVAESSTPASKDRSTFTLSGWSIRYA